jgi:hypothetical protein
MNYKQLLTVGTTDIPSSSQLWFHLGNIAVVALYIYIGIKIALAVGNNSTASIGLIDSFCWLTGVVSGIITGNKFANTLLHLKYKDKEDERNADTTESTK